MRNSHWFVICPGYGVQSFHGSSEAITMFYKRAFIRFVAIPTCLVWGVMEFLALQRSRLLGWRGRQLS